MGAIARRKKRDGKSTRIGLLAIAGAILLFAFAITAQNGMPGYLPGYERTSATIAFEDTGALRSGDEVRIGDLRAGFVSDIAREDGHSIAKIELDDGREVYSDASATIAARSGLGMKFVDLDPGTKEAGQLQGALSVDRTESPLELDDVLGALDPKTRKLGQSALRESGQGVVGRGGDLSQFAQDAPDILTNLGDISQGLAKDDGADLKDVLHSAELLASAMDQQRAQIAGTMQQTQVTLDALATDSTQPLAETVQKAGGTLESLRPALHELNGPLTDTRRAVVKLQPGAQALGESMPSLRGFLRDSPPVLDKVSPVMKDADPAVTNLSPMLDQAEPAVLQLGTTLARARTPLTTLAPYSPEVLQYFKNSSSALGRGTKTAHWLRFYSIVSPQTLTGILPIKAPLLNREAYPEPGEAGTHRTNPVQELP